MTASTLFFLLLVLACPLLMMFMMRGGHGHGGGAASHGGDGHEGEPRETSTDELRQQRAELDRLIDEREGSEHRQSDRELTSRGGGRR